MAVGIWGALNPECYAQLSGYRRDQEEAQPTRPNPPPAQDPAPLPAAQRAHYQGSRRQSQAL